MSKPMVQVFITVTFFICTSVMGQLPPCGQETDCPDNTFCNKGFEQTDCNKAWCINANDQTSFTATRVDNEFNTGAYSLKLSVNSFGTSTLVFPLPKNPTGDLIASQEIRLENEFESSSFETFIEGGYVSVQRKFNFQKGHTYEGRVWLKSPDNVEVEFMFRKGAPYFEAYAVDRITVTNTWTEYVIKGGFDESLTGTFNLNFLTTGTVYVDDADMADITTSVTNLSPPNMPVPPEFFGLHMNKISTSGPTTRPPIGFGLLRLWDSETRWLDLEISNGSWNWQKMDISVDLAKLDNSTKILYTLGMTPQWAAKYPGPLGGSYGWGSTSPPLDIANWADYVETVRDYFGSDISYYEIWNEVDVQSFWGGSVDEMMALQEVAWDKLHEDHEILSPNVTTNGLRWLEEYLEKGGGDFIDIVSIHYYPARMPENGIPYFEAVKSILKKKGYCCDGSCSDCKPIWNTEGANVFDATTIADSSLQMAAVSRSYIVQWAYGIRNFSWYMWENQELNTAKPSLSEPLNAAWAVTKVRSPGKAYKTTRDWLVGSTMVTKVVNAGDWKIKIIKANGSVAWVAWNTEGASSITIDETWAKIKKTDLLGNVTKNLSGTVAIGIEPVLFEEDDSEDGEGARIATQAVYTGSSEVKQNFTFALFPNPGSGIVNVSYTIAQDTHVKIHILDSFGKKISVLVDKYQTKGDYNTVLQNPGLPSGAYLCEFETSTEHIVKKLILIR